MAFESGTVDREPIDALDHLSVGQLPNLLEKYWQQVCPLEDPTSTSAKKLRGNVLNWSKELANVRNPVSHSPDDELSLRDLMRYVDSAARLMRSMEIQRWNDVDQIWSSLIDDTVAEAVAPPSILENLPSRESITYSFVGRSDHLTDLWRWIGDPNGRVWALVGDGGKGKTTIAYEFAVALKAVVEEFGLQGIVWMSAKQRRFVEGETVATSRTDFSTLDELLDMLLTTMGWADEIGDDTGAKRDRCLEVLSSFPMLIIADDIDSIDADDEDTIEFLSRDVPTTKSKVLLTSRRRPFGLGSCTTEVSGMSLDEVTELLLTRGKSIGLTADDFSSKRVKRIAAVTDGSPLYIEDLLRLSHFHSLAGAIETWAGRSGDAAREYALKRELELLSSDASFLLGVISLADKSVSLDESLAVLGGHLDEADAVAAMEELKNWNLLGSPSIVEGVPRFTTSRNLGKLMRTILKGTDEETRIKNGLKGLKGLAVGKQRTSPYIREAVALQQAGRLNEAEQALQNALLDVPNSADVSAMLGWLYSKWKPEPRSADACEWFEQAESLGHDDRNLYSHWADLQLRRREYRSAVEICDRAIDGPAPDDPFIWRIKGLALTRSGLLARQSLNDQAAKSSFREASEALLQAQRVSRAKGDLSRAFNARYELAIAMHDDHERRDVLREWKSRLPSDAFRPAD